MEFLKVFACILTLIFKFGVVFNAQYMILKLIPIGTQHYKK